MVLQITQIDLLTNHKSCRMQTLTKLRFSRNEFSDEEKDAFQVSYILQLVFVSFFNFNFGKYNKNKVLPLL